MKKILTVFLVLMMVLTLVACGDKKVNNTEENKPTEETRDVEVNRVTEEDANKAKDPEKTPENTNTEKTAVKSLSGPTTMGLAKLITDEKANDNSIYDFEVVTMAQDVVNGLVKGDIDIAAIPANLASTVFNKTKGKIQVAAVNTLSVVYIVDNDGSIKSIADLKGKTIYATGQGQTPEYILNAVLEANGLNPATDVTMEFKNEASEVASILASQENVVALLPQPFITVTQTKNDKVNVAIDLNEEWNKSQEGNVITGVLVVNTEYAKNNKETFNKFLDDYKASIEFVKTNVDESSDMIEQLGVVKAPIAKKAMPTLNITYMEGNDLKTNLESYLNVLFKANPQSIGGALPGEEFYYSR
ncbi:MAG: ABC transporter substrate-binding protein [Tissierellia bacterium]|nr:ABC transporter substrate-binding protein [Tissierellia bacterium]